MKVKELIKSLKEYNPEAEIKITAHCKNYDFSFVFGSAEGVKKENCDIVCLYVDELCSIDKEG